MVESAFSVQVRKHLNSRKVYNTLTKNTNSAFKSKFIALSQIKDRKKGDKEEQMEGVKEIKVGEEE